MNGFFISAITALLLVSPAVSQLSAQDGAVATVPTGNVIFIHPDGTGLQHWAACRMLNAGPDGEIAWDKLPQMGIYRGHMKDGLTSTSHGGATTHAYGVKVVADSYGMDGKEPLKALSGFDGSIMQEALASGNPVGIINSGHMGEPGTGAFLGSVPERGMKGEVARQIMESGAAVIMCGGEELLLPTDVEGFHGMKGTREDGHNLIEEARENGYTVVFDRDQLQAVDPAQTKKLLGIFAASDTYNAEAEEKLAESGLPLYMENAPTVAEMLDVALPILAAQEEDFLLVLEEEGTDNFSNSNNTAGALEALTRADAAIARALEFLEQEPDTLIITAADSDAGGLQVHSPGKSQMRNVMDEDGKVTGRVSRAFDKDESLPETIDNGAPLDGVTGQGGKPFVSAPDSQGQTFTFGIAYAGFTDFSGGIVSKAAGLNSEKLGSTVDNTDIYRMMYLTLFGKDLPSPVR